MMSDIKKRKSLSLKRKQAVQGSQGDKHLPVNFFEVKKKDHVQVCEQKLKLGPLDDHGRGTVSGSVLLCGLENMGNTCYISAVIQALRCAPRLHSGVMRSHLEVREVQECKALNRAIPSPPDHILHSAFAKLLNEMKQAEEKKMVTGRGPSLKPDEFVNVVQTIFPRFVKKEQHDAQEFLRCLLGTLQLEQPSSSLIHKDQASNQCQMNTSSSQYLQNSDSNQQTSDPSPCSFTTNECSMIIPNQAKKRSLTSPTTPTLSSSAKRGCLHETNKITSFFKAVSQVKSKKVDLKKSVVVDSSDDESNTVDVKPITSPQVSWVTELFEGTLTSQMCCLECEEKSSREETFLDISVPVTTTAEQENALEEHKCAPVSLSWSISQYASSERLCGRDKYWCDRCHHFTEGRRTVYFSKLPKIMTIHLNRFSHKWHHSQFSIGKTAGNIAIPLNLSFSQWCLPSYSSTSMAQLMYELYAVVLHTGSSCTSGHYTTIVKTTYSSSYSSLPPSHTQTWTLFNDEQTTRLSQKSFDKMISPLSSSSSSSPYILFYTQMTK